MSKHLRKKIRRKRVEKGFSSKPAEIYLKGINKLYDKYPFQIMWKILLN